MNRAAVVGSCMALLARSALAAPGDDLVVAADAVNVRAGPGKEYRVRLQVDRNRPAIELAREGEWVRVELTGSDVQGWIHQSLLEVSSRAQPAVAPAPGVLPDPSVQRSSPSAEPAQAAPVAESEALAQFRSSIDMLNERALAAAGVELFSGVEPAGDGAVRVHVTEAWAMVPEAGQTSYTNALFGHWQAVADSPEPLRVQVVDPSGTVVSEKSTP
jgi:uncharacterized protein YgiM (DUF1202 family)